MKLKEANAVNVFLTTVGRIAIEQDSLMYGSLVSVFLTYEQFQLIAEWVENNKDEIMKTWNDGVEDA